MLHPLRPLPMTALALLPLAFAAATACSAPPAEREVPAVRTATADSLAALYASGVPFSDFRRAAKRRTHWWNGNYEKAPVDAALVRRAREAGAAGMKVLVVAEDGCGDSANTIPYLARFLDAVGGIEMRIVNAKDGRWVMEAHRSRDGRAATPTVLLLDADHEFAGCWVERPAPLHEWFEASRDTMPQKRLYDRKYAWYDEDLGRTTVREFVEMLEGHAAGTPICARGTPR